MQSILSMAGRIWIFVLLPQMPQLAPTNQVAKGNAGETGEADEDRKAPEKGCRAADSSAHKSNAFEQRLPSQEQENVEGTLNQRWDQSCKTHGPIIEPGD
jgi:hypothetical protein